MAPRQNTLPRRHGVEVTGFTLSAQQHKLAAARPGALTFNLHDRLANTCDDSEFDRAYAIESTEHMHDKQRFFDEAYRNSARRASGDLRMVGGVEREQVADRSSTAANLQGVRLSAGMGTQEEYLAMATKAGFEPLGHEDISRQVSRTWSICTRRFIGNRPSTAPVLALNSGTRNRDFILSLPRLIAYRTG